MLRPANDEDEDVTVQASAEEYSVAATIRVEKDFILLRWGCSYFIVVGLWDGCCRS